MGNILASLFERLFGKEDVRILMVGLDNAGKTTILYKLKLGDVIHTIPTVGFNVETVEYKNINFTVWDIGGQDKIRPLWRRYYHGVNGVIFVVDSADAERMDDSTWEFNSAKEELHKLLMEDELKDAVILILANKKDLTNALSVSEISRRLGLNEIRNGRKWFIQPTCAMNGQGIMEGMDWLANHASSSR